MSDHSDDLVFKVIYLLNLNYYLIEFKLLNLLQKGDQIYITRRVNDEWLEGSLNECTGMFPISYVEITEPLPEESNQEIRKVIAVFTFKPECWEDLSIKVIIKFILITILYSSSSSSYNFIFCAY